MGAADDIAGRRALTPSIGDTGIAVSASGQEVEVALPSLVVDAPFGSIEERVGESSRWEHWFWRRVMVERHAVLGLSI
jgi:hypothetical protein